MVFFLCLDQVWGGQPVKQHLQTLYLPQSPRVGPVSGTDDPGSQHALLKGCFCLLLLFTHSVYPVLNAYWVAGTASVLVEAIMLGNRTRVRGSCL